jgi:uncharacterized OB-fold protein
VTTSVQVPIAPGLFSWPADEPCLLGGKCSSCGIVTFPTSPGCPRCGNEGMEVKPLSRLGTVWTWTTQGFRPKHPYRGYGSDDDFEPFILGYVELDGEVRVESRLLVDRRDIHIDMEVELVIEPLYQNEAGEEVVTFAFAAHR